MPKPAYNWRYQKQRAAILASRPPCYLCGAPGANSVDHVPPLWRHQHREGSGCCRLYPAHLRCNIRHSGAGWAVVNQRRRARVRYTA